MSNPVDFRNIKPLLYIDPLSINELPITGSRVIAYEDQIRRANYFLAYWHGNHKNYGLHLIAYLVNISSGLTYKFLGTPKRITENSIELNIALTSNQANTKTARQLMYNSISE